MATRGLFDCDINGGSDSRVAKCPPFITTDMFACEETPDLILLLIARTMKPLVLRLASKVDDDVVVLQ